MPNAVSLKTENKIVLFSDFEGPPFWVYEQHSPITMFLVYADAKHVAALINADHETSEVDRFINSNVPTRDLFPKHGARGC